MMQEIINDLRRDFWPHRLEGCELNGRHVRNLLLFLDYVEREFQKPVSPCDGAAPLLLEPAGNVVPLRSRHRTSTSDGPPDGGPAA